MKGIDTILVLLPELYILLCRNEESPMKGIDTIRPQMMS